MELLKSASKIVLITFALVLAIAFLYATLANKIEGAVIADIFKISIGAVLGFYFANKGDANQQYLGK